LTISYPSVIAIKWPLPVYSQPDFSGFVTYQVYSNNSEMPGIQGFLYKQVEIKTKEIKHISGGGLLFSAFMWKF